MGFDEVVCLGIIKLKVLFIVEERQVEPLPSSRFHRVDHVLDASPDENSIIRKRICISATNFARGRKCFLHMEHLLGVNLVTLDNRMLLFVAPVADVEIEIADEVSALAVDVSETLLKLFIARAVESREEVVVRQAVFLLARCHVVAVIMFTTTFVDFLVASEIFVAVGRVSWSTPFCARKAQVDSFLSLPVPLNCRFAHF